MLLNLKEDLKTSSRDMSSIKDELNRVKMEKLKQDDGITSFVRDEVFGAYIRFYQVNRLSGDLRKEGNDDMSKIDNFTN